jgi:uncharacterized membrane protein YkvA (DUF1232 family)
MPDIADFVHHGAAMVTPTILKRTHKKLPYLKLKYTEFDDPAFPHLTDQLEFLADVLEDFAEGVEDELPYYMVAAVAFAIIHSHRQFDLISNAIPNAGLADDSAVVRMVLFEHEGVLSAYALRHKMKWEAITLQP